MKFNQIFKQTLNLVGTYSAGVIISASFVLLTNDIFYNSVFRNLAGSNRDTKKMWEEIRPREIFNKGAKSTFLKHQLEEERDDETTRYHKYILAQKNPQQDKEKENAKIYENIFEKKDK